MYFYVNNVNAAFKKALAVGGAVWMPVQDMFWGDRIGVIQDPFGYLWTLATHVADVAPEDMARGAGGDVRRSGQGVIVVRRCGA